jgi:hypothetical protein
MSEETLEAIRKAYAKRKEAISKANHTLYEDDKKNDPNNAELNRRIALARIDYANKRLEDALTRQFDDEWKTAP